MTFLGKVLVVTQIVFSLIFMTFAGAVYFVQTDWKKTHDAVKTTLGTTTTQLNDEREAHENTKTQSTATVKEAVERAETAEAKLNSTEQQLADEKKRHETTTIEKNRAVALAEVAEKASIARREEAVEQRTVNKRLHDELDRRVGINQELEARIFDLERIDKDRTKKHNDLLNLLAFYKEIIKKNEIDTDPAAYAGKQLPPPKIDGVVRNTKIDKDKGTQLVEISLGSDDGVAIGHRLFVSRPGKYLGKIKIVRVTADRAVGTVIQRAKNGIIEEGDHVSAKL